MKSSIVAALVKSVLETRHAYAWTVQGFGQLRTKISNVGRIHVWDSRLRVPLVSDIHEHPWDLESEIISGELINQRFVADVAGATEFPYMVQTIATGEGGGLRGEPAQCSLFPARPEFYSFGMSYDQKADEIHRSIPMDGTVTLMQRRMGEPLQETRVYWPLGFKWVSAEPRYAQWNEIEEACTLALARWQSL